MADDDDALGIVVVNFASHSLLARNLGSLDLRGPAVQVVVVDNYSSDDERRRMTELAAARGWTVVPMRDNAGFGAGVNTGVRAARALGCHTFLVLNPDAFAPLEVVEGLRAEARSDRLALVVPRIVTTAGADYFVGATVDMTSGRMYLPETARRHTREWVNAACIAFHEELFDRLGGFDERYFLYWEDVDLSLRAVDAGCRLTLLVDLCAIHDEGGSQDYSGRAKSTTYYFYNCRNRLLFASQHLGRKQLLGWLLRTPMEGWQILLRGGRRQLLQSPRPLIATIAGSLAGILIALRALVIRPEASARSTNPS